MNLVYSMIPVLLVLLFQPVYAQELIYESGGDLIREQAAFNVYHYELDLRVNPQDSTIAGTVVVRADIVQPTDVIVLDLDPRFEIESISEVADGGSRKLTYETQENSKRVYIYFPFTRQPAEKIKVTVEYNGQPLVAANPPWDGGFVWNETPSGEPWIGVACQTIGAWVWWPNKDHPSDKPDSVSLNFTLPEDLVVASNGSLRGTTDSGDGWKTWHWFNSTPISNYNVTLNAAPYETISEPFQSVTGEEFEFTFWVLPEFYDDGKELFPELRDQMRFMEELLGPYPFRADKYGVAHTPYLGMEHQSIIAYGAGFRHGSLFGQFAPFDDLHQHELAHEWWGNMVTAWDWRDFWIHEGFGTYMQALYAEHLGGTEAYHDLVRYFRRMISSEWEIAPFSYQSSVDVYGGGRGGDIYYKGATVLHTLRYLLGDELFFESLRRFLYPNPDLRMALDGSHIRFVTTDDYLETVNEMTGEDYSWFFEVYVRRADLPQLSKTRNDDGLLLEWRVPEEIDWPMSVEVMIDDQIIRYEPKEGRRSIWIEAPPDAELTVDPNRWILMELEAE